MSRNRTKQFVHRDYGATSSAVNAITAVPDTTFSGFSPTEFVSLSESITQNINSVKDSWQQLKKFLQLIEANNCTPNLNEKVQKIQTMANAKIQTTSKDLERLTAVVRRGDKQQKLQVEKLTVDFRDVVEKYSVLQQSVVVKMKKMYLSNFHSQLDEEQNSSMADNAQLIEQQKIFKKESQMEHEMFLEQEASIKQIEANVLDTNAIMKELNTIIVAQEEQIGLVESNVEQIHADVEAGTSELMKAAQSRTRHRRKVLILLVIAVIIGLIVTGIIISQIKS